MLCLLIHSTILTERLKWLFLRAGWRTSHGSFVSVFLCLSSFLKQNSEESGVRPSHQKWSPDCSRCKAVLYQRSFIVIFRYTVKHIKRSLITRNNRRRQSDWYCKAIRPNIYMWTWVNVLRCNCILFIMGEHLLLWLLPATHSVRMTSINLKMGVKPTLEMWTHQAWYRPVECVQLFIGTRKYSTKGLKSTKTFD